MRNVIIYDNIKTLPSASQLITHIRSIPGRYYSNYVLIQFNAVN